MLNVLQRLKFSNFCFWNVLFLNSCLNNFPFDLSRTLDSHCIINYYYYISDLSINSRPYISELSNLSVELGLFCVKNFFNLLITKWAIIISFRLKILSILFIFHSMSCNQRSYTWTLLKMFRETPCKIRKGLNILNDSFRQQTCQSCCKKERVCQI